MDPAALVAFVMRSDNRLQALVELADGAQSRPDLQDRTGIPRATLSRILADYQERHLVRRDGHEYSLTLLGHRLAGELEGLFAALEETVALQTVASWLPLADLDVAIADLENLRVTLPSLTDPMSPVSRAASIVGRAETVRGFCYSVLHAPILTETEAVVRDGRTFEGVVARGVLDVIAADPALSAAMTEMAATGRADIWVYDGTIGPQLIIADDVVTFLATDTDGTIQGLIETDDDRVHPWAERTYTEYKTAAERIDPDGVAELLTS